MRINKLSDIIKTVIKEEQIKSNTEICLKLYGNGLWSNAEANTDTEVTTKKALKQFTDNKHGKLLDSNSEALVIRLKSLQRCMMKYPEILTPNNKGVYRGVSYTLLDAIKIAQKTHYKEKFKYTYKPKSFVQSWTESFLKSKEFATQHHNTEIHNCSRIIQKIQSGEELGYYDMEILNDGMRRLIEKPMIGYVLITKADPKNFLFNAEYFNNISAYGGEDETLRISQDPIVCDWRIVDQDVNDFIIPYYLKNKKDFV